MNDEQPKSPTEPKDTKESKELERAIASLDKLLLDHELHPALRNVLLAAQKDDGSWNPSFSADELAAMESALLAAQVHGMQSLLDAVASALRIAPYLGKEPGGLKAGAMLLAVTEKVIHEKNLLQILRKDAEFEPGRLAAAKEAVGSSARAQPQKLGEKAPEGAVRIDQLPGGKRRV